MNILDVVVGKPIKTSDERAEQIGPAQGVPIFGLDGVSSAAYGPEAALSLLLPLGLLGVRYIVPISAAIITLLVIVYFSYRQTIAAYPSGGGSYTVARFNLGAPAGLLAAAALLADYILTAAVGISAGVGALVSAVPSLLGERDVGRDVSLCVIDRAQNLAPVPVRVTGLLCRGGLKARSNLLLEGGQSGLVERRCGVLLDFVAERVGIVVHPREQPGSRLIRIGVRGLTGFDPEADEILGKLSEAAARVVEFIGFSMAAGQEGLAECDATRRFRFDDIPDAGDDLVKSTDKREARAVGDVSSRAERQLDLPLDRVCLGARPAFHNRPPSSSAPADSAARAARHATSQSIPKYAWTRMLRKAMICGQGTWGWRVLSSSETRAAASPIMASF